MKERQVNSIRGLAPAGCLTPFARARKWGQAPELPGARLHFLNHLTLLMEQRS
jgi:hypothetical protein